jgi:3-hydroxyisobutyrate dehydrogenase-like beta-hydroxyacid dehydrogenase
MARNLVANSHPNSSGGGGRPHLLVWNRTRAKAEELVEELGADRVRIAKSVGEIATECDIVITNLANDEVVRAIYEEFAKALQASPPTLNKIFVETSTIFPKTAGKLDKLITSVSHTHFITSPVFGAPPAAEKAELIIVMSGDYRSKKEVAYLFVPAIGRKVIDLGGNLEKAPTFKLIGNSMILGFMEVLAESFTLADKTGIGAQAACDFLTEFMPAGPIVAYANKMIDSKFDGSKGFAIDGGIKDASHIRRLTTEHDAPMPTIDLAHHNLLTARALHAVRKREGKEVQEVLDWSALIAGARVSAGLEPFEAHSTSSVEPEEE